PAAVSAFSANDVIAVGPCNQVLRSTDGKSFTMLETGISGLSGNVVTRPDWAGVWASGWDDVWLISSQQAFRSNDDAKSWQPVALPGGLTPAAIHGARDGRVFIVGGNTIVSLG